MKFIEIKLNNGYLLSGGVTFGNDLYHQAIYKPILLTNLKKQNDE